MSTMGKLYVELQVQDALMEVFDMELGSALEDKAAELISALEGRNIELRPL